MEKNITRCAAKVYIRNDVGPPFRIWRHLRIGWVAGRGEGLRQVHRGPKTRDQRLPIRDPFVVADVKIREVRQRRQDQEHGAPVGEGPVRGKCGGAERTVSICPRPKNTL